MTDQELNNILTVGLKAVSPYNSQPWEFELRGGRLLIFTRNNELGFWKNKNTMFFSLGAFLENLSEGARHEHYEISFTLLQTQERVNLTRPICEATFTKTASTEPYPIAHVLSRYTNRKTYRPDPIPPSVLADIRAAFSGPTREVLDVTKHMGLINSCAETETVRVSNQHLRDELFANISFPPEDASKGLDIRTLELPAFVQGFMRLNRSSLFRTTIGQSFIARWFMKNSYRKLLSTTPLLIAFKQTNQSPAMFVADWMIIQRILNDLRRKGLNSQLMGSATELTRVKKSFLHPREAKIISNAEDQVKKSLGVELSSLLTLLRIGYAEECETKSLRKNPADLFWQDKA